MKKLKLDLENIQGYNHAHAPFDFSEEEKVQGKVVDVNEAIPKPMVENTNTTVNPSTLEVDSYTREVEDSNRVLVAAIESLKTKPTRGALVKLQRASQKMTRVVSQEFFWNKKEEKKPAPQKAASFEPAQALSFQESVKKIKAACKAYDNECGENTKPLEVHWSKHFAYSKQQSLRKPPTALLTFFKELGGLGETDFSEHLGDFKGYLPASLKRAISEHDTNTDFTTEEDEENYDYADDMDDEPIHNQAGLVKKYWSMFWFPIAENGGGDCFFYDCQPGSGGKVGQIGDWSHEQPEQSSILYKSLEDYVIDLARFVKLPEASQEACASCQNASQSVGAAFNQAGNQAGTSSFQYAETSDKEKEVIMLTGPLGEAYTHALNIKFKKKPLFVDGKLPEDLSESEQDLVNNSSMVSQESQQQDHDASSNLVAALDFIEAKKEEVANTFTFIDNNTVATNAVDDKNVLAVIGTADDLFDPERVEEICATAKQRKNVIVVCHVPTDLANAGIRIQEDFLDLNAVNPHADMRKRLRTSLCSVYSSEKISVCVGIEDLGYHLLDQVQA